MVDHRSGKTTQDLRVVGEMLEKDAVVDFEMSDSSGEVVLSKKRKIGEWGVTPRFGKNAGFRLTSEKILSGGYYSLKIEFKNGEQFESWILLHNYFPFGRAEISSPLPREKVSVKALKLAWNKFASPRKQPFEKSVIMVSLFDSIQPKWKNNVFKYVGEPKFDLIDLRSPPEGVKIKKKVEPGAYLFNVTFQERRDFNGILLVRKNVVLVPFEVETGSL